MIQLENSLIKLESSIIHLESSLLNQLDVRVIGELSNSIKELRGSNSMERAL